MEIKEVALKINELATNHKMADFQEIRKELKNKDKVGSKKIFSQRSIFNNYAFHSGGRKEFQYNIAYEKDAKVFRYGLAFSLQKNQALQDPVKTQKPKIDRFNEYIFRNHKKFSDILLWYYKNTHNLKKKERFGPFKIRIIDNELIKNNTFIFIGKYFKKRIHELSIKDYDEILKTFDRLLELYEFVESDNKKDVKFGNVIDEDNFIFIPGHNEAKKSTIVHHSQKEIKMKHIHSRMQKKSFNQLVKIYGSENVGTETGVCSQIDLVIKNKNSYIFYEFKTSDSIKECIREALGQLLEYAYYPNKSRAKKLVIVSPNKINEEAKIYLKHLRKEFNIPVYYRRYNLKSDFLEETEY